MSGEQPKRNFGPVTTIPCTCLYLERAATEPDNPIVFDELVNEYQFRHFNSGGMSVIRHCPWCGGAAPESKRDSLFAHITHAERERLEALAEDVKTVADVLARFGSPDSDLANGYSTSSAPSDTKPSVVSSHRVLRYTKLSETADVDFMTSSITDRIMACG